MTSSELTPEHAFRTGAPAAPAAWLLCGAWCLIAIEFLGFFVGVGACSLSTPLRWKLEAPAAGFVGAALAVGLHHWGTRRWHGAPGRVAVPSPWERRTAPPDGRPGLRSCSEPIVPLDRDSSARTDKAVNTE